MTPSARALLIAAALTGCAKEEAKVPVIETEIGWPALSKLNVESGAKPESLAHTLAQPIRIHGYAMPLDTVQNGVMSFLLVPDRSYCIHVPPPPPNQLIHVELEKPLHWRLVESGLWLTGSLEVVEQKSEFGRFMYKMKELTWIESADW